VCHFFSACLINLRHSYFEDWALSTCAGNSSMKTEIGSLGCWQANSGHYCKLQGQYAFQQQNRISGAFISHCKYVSLNLSYAFLVAWEFKLIYIVEDFEDTDVGKEDDLQTVERLLSNSGSLHPNEPPSNLLVEENPLPCCSNWHEKNWWTRVFWETNRRGSLSHLPWLSV